MNVMKTEFVTKQKRLRERNQRGVKALFSRYRSVSGPSYALNNFFNLPQSAEEKENNQDLLSVKSSTFEKSVRESKTLCEVLQTDEIYSTNTTKKSVSDTIRDLCVTQGQNVTNESTNTSLEFKKFLASFHNFRLNTDKPLMDSNENKTALEILEKVSPKLRRKEMMKPICKRRRDGKLPDGNDISKTSCEVFIQSQDSSSLNMENICKQYNICNFSIPTSQKRDEDVRRNNSLWFGRGQAVLQTPNKKILSDFSYSRSEMKTPRTGKSPKMSVSSKLTNSNAGAYILAVTEGRGHARGEVGIAGMDPKRPHLILCQISDTQRYVHSLTKMNIFNFVEVIVPNTFVDCTSPNKLYCDIRSRFPTVTLTSVQRRHFSETVGIDLIKQYCSPESTSLMMLLRDKFYALSAAAALIKYIEFTQNVHLAPHSLRIEYQGTEDTMIIDLDTANRLELVMCMSHPEINYSNSLLGVVKHCHTKGGIRLLRANILQPPCTIKKIQRRLDCVTELVNNPLLFCAIEAAVASFANLENLLNLCMHAPRQDGLRVSEYQLKYTLLLKTELELLPVLMTALKDAKSDYFCEVQENLKDPRYIRILDRILETVFENAKSVKGSVAAHLHGCFAIKTGVNSLLDVAKKTYCEIVQEISDHVAKLRENHGLPLRISFSANKGFHIQYTLPPDHRNMKKDELPKEFILVQKSRTTFSFYTAELVALDQRSQHVLNEIKLMTNVILYELLTDVREHIGCLYNLCEYIAELDVLLSFAHVGSGTNYCRPTFGDELKLTDSRHPILDVIHEGEVVPNDVNATIGQNFTILTGPNQSGKSIYIRQVALLQVMAQIGCYVPAKEATFRLTDRIFSRIGFDDSIESNACTLIVEMRDIEYMKQHITPNSLVIIDELCRGTSIDEGTSLAFAICEMFIDSSAFIFFTTHYMFLTKLADIYSNVVNFHFETNMEIEGKPSMHFTHLRKPGATEAELYGLHLADVTSFPKDVTSKAKEISVKLSNDRKARPTVKGLLARYNLSKQLRYELTKCNSDLEWDTTEPVIRRFKHLYLKLSSEGNSSFSENSLHSCEKSMKTPRKNKMPLNATKEVSGRNIKKRKIFRQNEMTPTLIQKIKEKRSIVRLADAVKKKYKKLHNRQNGHKGNIRKL